MTSSGTPGDLMLPVADQATISPPGARAAVAEPAATTPSPEFPQAEALVADTKGTESPEADARGTESPRAAIPGDRIPPDEAPGAEPADEPDDTVVFVPPVRPQGPPPRVPATRPPAKPPPWARVLATTLRLWVQRRLRRRSRPRRATMARIVVLVLVVAVVVGAGAVTVALTRTGAPAGHGQGGTGALDTAATVRGQAASWVASQVAADAIVACDPAMCSVLQSKGIPASLLLVLASGKADPLGSDVVMATADVRSQFGSRLVGVYAPVVLASFGQGSAQIAVRAVAPDGAAAYLSQLRSDWRARAVAGRQLLHNSRLHASAAARQQLAAGAVDSRLLTTLATMAALYPVDVAGFSGSGAHASAGVPLRSAEISGATGAAGTGSTPTLSSLKAFLLAQRAPYLPAEMDIARLATGQAVLRVVFTAPSPLGLLGSTG